MQQKRIVVIGSYLVALAMDTDRMPQEGETVHARNFRQTHGGKGANQAVQAGRLGAPVLFAGCVGADVYGDSFVMLCRSEGIDATNLCRSQTLPTGAGFITCFANGHNIISIDTGANKELSPQVIDKTAGSIAPGDIVLIQLEIPLNTALYAASVAKKAGATVILNPAPAAPLSGCDLSFVDFITPNETEARICCNQSPVHAVSNEDVASELLLLGCKHVVITQGEKGCFVLSESVCFQAPAFPVRPVDSTGAGDAFNAALAVALIEGQTLQDACLFANAAAALSCTKADTVPSYHTRKEVQAFLNSF